MTTRIDGVSAPAAQPSADRLVATIRRAGPGLRRLGLGAGLESTPARVLRRRLFRIRRHEVELIMVMLAEAGVPAWLAGGWGVDALLGRETRPHSDVDLCVRASDADGAGDALLRMGYTATADREAGGPSFPIRAVLRDKRGRTIDLLLVRRPGDALTDPETGIDLPTLENDDVTVGRLGSRPFPCLSLALQVESHQGYPPARRDHLDLRNLGNAFDIELPPAFESRRPHLDIREFRRHASRLRTTSALFVAVPGARPLLSELGATQPDLPPHVTVLYPFLKPRSIGQRELELLRRLVASVPAQTVTFDHLDAFGPKPYLAPADPAPFLALTETLTSQWPNHQPYRGAYDRIVPHVMIDVPGLTFGDAVRHSAQFLPFSHQMDEIELAVRDHRGRWSTRARFGLGGNDQQG